MLDLNSTIKDLRNQYEVWRDSKPFLKGLDATDFRLGLAKWKKEGLELEREIITKIFQSNLNLKYFGSKKPSNNNWKINERILPKLRDLICYFKRHELNDVEKTWLIESNFKEDDIRNILWVIIRCTQSSPPSFKREKYIKDIV